MPETLRLALVTDIHAGRQSLTKRGAEAIPLLQDFVAFADSDEYDLVLELGDRITDTNPEQDRMAAADPIDVTVALGGRDNTWIEPLPSFAELAERRRQRATSTQGQSS